MFGPSFRDANMDAPIPVLSVRSIRLPAPDRGEDLQLRISAPIRGENLPIVILSHGFGSSMDGYAPIADYWAARGFVVVQPTFLDSLRLGMSQDDPRFPSIWRTRVDDVKLILGNLDALEQSVPGLAGRLNQALIAAAGHSFGGQTTSLLIGARMIKEGDSGLDLSDPRIKAAVLFASGGKGGSDLNALGKQITPYLDSSFDHMALPALMVVGDADNSPLTDRGPDWFREVYDLSPGNKVLLTLFGGEHMLGGISGYRVTETSDEKPERVGLVQQVTLAYLRYQLLGDEAGWAALCSKVNADPQSFGRIEAKATG